MKILAKVNADQDIYYNTLDQVQDQMQSWLDKIEKQYDCDIHIVQDYDDTFDRDDLVLNFYVGDMYDVTTPNGYIVELRSNNPTNEYKPSYMHLYASEPIYLDSKYGEIVFDAGQDLGFYGYSSGISLDTNLRLCRGRFKNAPSVEEADVDIDGMKSRILSSLSKLPEYFDDIITNTFKTAVARKKLEAEKAAKKREAEEAANEEARRHAELFNTPVTTRNISKVFTQFRKDSSGKLTAKGNVLRYVSYENDFVEYFDINDMVSELSSEGISLGELLEDPDMILDYGSIGSEGVQYANDASNYKEFKKSMNEEYGFSR